MDKAKLVRLALYVEVTVDPTLSDEEAEEAVREMWRSGDACASTGEPELVSIQLVDIDEDGCPIN